MKPTTTAGTAKKPATRKKATTRRKAPARPKPAAKPKVEETVTEPAPSAPPVPEVQNEQPAPPVVAAPPPPPPPSAEPAQEAIAAAERVSIGTIKGVLMHVPPATVLGLLGEDLQNRVANLHCSEAISDLTSRMRGTDGRCAPVYFTVAENEQPKLFAHVESLAAAIDLGMTTVPVIIVPAGDGGYLQGYLNAEMHQRGKETETEDDLLYRVMSEDE